MCHNTVLVHIPVEYLKPENRSELIGLIRKIPTLKPLYLEMLNFTHLMTSIQQKNAENFNLISLIVKRVIATRKYNKHIAKCCECTEGVQMSHFYIVHPTGLLCTFMHNIPIFEPKAMKFGKHVPE